jgi:SAM-dependent methyltransferase
MDASQMYQPTHRTKEWGQPFKTDDARLAQFVSQNPARRNALAAFVRDFAASLHPGCRVLDAGAGSMPYASLLAHTSYMTLDWPNSVHGRQPDIVGDLSKPINAADQSFDAVLCTEVLEHIFDIPSALREVYRLLRAGGRLAGTTPFLIQLHEEPHDYWRPTAYALRRLLSEAGFSNIEIHPLTGYFGSIAIMLRWFPLMTGATKAMQAGPEWQHLKGLASKAADWLVAAAWQLDERFDTAKRMPAGYAFTATRN